MSLQDAIQEGLAHHRAGNLDRAEQIYREILRIQPNHAQALHGLGVAAHQRGNNDLAADLIGRALQAKPHEASFLNSLVAVRRAQGRFHEALAAAQQAMRRPGPFASSNFVLTRIDCAL